MSKPADTSKEQTEKKSKLNTGFSNREVIVDFDE